MSNFIEIRLVGVEMFNAGGRADGRRETTKLKYLCVRNTI